jgi:hypothetical protein
MDAVQVLTGVVVRVRGGREDNSGHPEVLYRQ